MFRDGLTLSHPDKNVRDYWIAHAQSCRKIAEYFGRELNQTALNDIWIPDGYKDVPADRLSPRRRLKESLDTIFSQPIDRRYELDAVAVSYTHLSVKYPGSTTTDKNRWWFALN